MRTWPALAACLVLSASGACAGDDLLPETGSRQAGIVGGSATSAYPSVPLLSYDVNGYTAICSGTLISPRVVLSSAVCLSPVLESPQSIRAYFGSDSQTETDPTHVATIAASKIDVHPRFSEVNAITDGYDIGLMLLERAPPVAPMAYNRTPLGDREGEDLRLIGWGSTSSDQYGYGVKREVMVSLLGQTDLFVLYGAPDRNTCFGDTGGPSLVTDGATEIVAGLSSFGSADCTGQSAGTNVATFASSYIDPFIKQNDGGGCLADDACNAVCGDVDPDCAEGGGGDDGGDEDSDDGSDGSGDQGHDIAQGDTVGGCAAGGSGSRGVAPLALVALIALAGIQRSRRRS